MATLLIASSNPGKLQELHALLKDLPLSLLQPDAIGIESQVEESGKDYAENARLKASAYARASGLWTLADDSGLEVEVLDNAPGMRSARLAGAGRSDSDRRRLLLEMLRPHPRPWKARFRCMVALVSPDGDVSLAEGICQGEIVPMERGSGGFGYDPIFQVKGTGQTMAELAPEEKNRISHRARAIETLMPILLDRLGLS
jgi:XTP/dITP diphosphohydrolase